MTQKRIKAFIIDYSISFFMFFIISFPIIFFYKKNGNNAFDYLLFLFLLPNITLFFRDIISGQGIGKIKYGLIVKHESQREPFSEYFLLRNLTLLIFFIDIAYYSIAGKRLGDFILIPT
jgi:uncharacterized RDD family membrane protein YckC